MYMKNTKAKLKEAFLKELNEKTFEQVHVSNICMRAHISRVTFYNWYNDKYELLDDLFNDLIEQMKEEMEELQKKNNPEDDPIQAYCNLLHVIMAAHNSQYDFLSRAERNDDQWLYYYYYTSIRHGTEALINRYSGKISPRVGKEETAAFICGGIWDFIRTCRSKNMSSEEIEKEAEELLKAMLTSRVFY
jgi:AcrR family transcriptional regulator